MDDKLKIEFPSQGWAQILTSRKEMLDAYDRARQQARAHEVEVFHGKVAEASCRKWLSSFLPKRYGVTSGYIVSPGLKSSDKAPHFDVVIYDQLESPILWVEDNPDASEQGRSLAIPVEHVRAVLEVKSRFSARTVKEAIEHLSDLAPVMKGPDDPNERYKLHLPASFFCGTLHFELLQADEFSEAAVAANVEGVALRGFMGGLVLRAEGHTAPASGRMSITNSETPIETNVGRGKSPISEFGLSSSIQVTDKLHLGALITWHESNFAQFAFDLVALLQGTYQNGRVSSFYGLGKSFTESMRDIGARQLEIGSSELGP
jgi:hypothetical protein